MLPGTLPCSRSTTEDLITLAEAKNRAAYSGLSRHDDHQLGEGCGRGRGRPNDYGRGNGRSKKRLGAPSQFRYQ